MSPNADHLPLDSVLSALSYLRRRGVRLWVDDGKLRYTAPEGALTASAIAALKQLKVPIIDHLKATREAEARQPHLVWRPRKDRAPLTYSQLAHWHTLNPEQHRSIRDVAVVMRIAGRLNMDALSKSMAVVIRRHDALRTRIVVEDDAPTQKILGSGEVDIEFDDLTGQPERELRALIDAHILQPIDLSTDSLVGIRIVRLGKTEHLFVMALEHIITDAHSMYILWRDILLAYQQLRRGLPAALPKVSLQFSDYAAWQRSTQQAWIDRHGEYWQTRLAGCPRIRFPTNDTAVTASRVGWAAVPFRISRELKEALSASCRRKRVTLVMGVFTAYVALVMRWCRVSDMVIRFQVSGRDSPDLAHTIGYLASVLCVRIDHLPRASLAELSERVVAEYCNALEHADASYSEAKIPRHGFTLNTRFNWIPAGESVDIAEVEDSGDALMCSRFFFDDPTLNNLALDAEPFIVLLEKEGEITGDLCFPRNRFARESMESFVRNFQEFLMILVGQPSVLLQDIKLVP